MNKKSIIAIIVTIVICISIVIVTIVTTKSTASSDAIENNNSTNTSKVIENFTQYSDIKECPNIRNIDIAKAINKYTKNNNSIFVRNNPGVFIDASKDTNVNPYLILAFTSIKYGWENESKTINFRDIVYDTAYMIKDVYITQENCKNINDMVNLNNTNYIDQQSAYTIVDIVNTSYKN